MTIFEEAVSQGVIVQGVTGATGRRQVRQMVDYGTRIVAGVTPGRGGEEVDGVPVFDTVAAAVRATGARASIAFLPPQAAAEGVLEAAEAGIQLLVCTTEGVPLHDEVKAVQHAHRHGMRLVGPNTSGLMVPGAYKLGFMPTDTVASGHCAVLSRSGTLSYEVVHALSDAGIGLSLWVGLGGDRVKGTTFVEILPAVLEDASTRAVVLIGEIGGTEEEQAAELLRGSLVPVIAIIAGRSAPEGVSMGHAGAMISGGLGTYNSKREALEASGIPVALSPAEVAAWVATRLADTPAAMSEELTA